MTVSCFEINYQRIEGSWESLSEKLHANGQAVQQGERNILETFLMLQEHDNRVQIPGTDEDLDGLNFLTERGLDMGIINRKVIEGPAYAHYEGGIPNMTVEIPKRNAYNLGHSPFIQPGVEAYKQVMFALIGRPGFDKKARDMEENLKKMKRIRI